MECELACHEQLRWRMSCMTSLSPDFGGVSRFSVRPTFETSAVTPPVTSLWTAGYMCLQVMPSHACAWGVTPASTPWGGTLACHLHAHLHAKVGYNVRYGTGHHCGGACTEWEPLLPMPPPCSPPSSLSSSDLGGSSLLLQHLHVKEGGATTYDEYLAE